MNEEMKRYIEERNAGGESQGEALEQRRNTEMERKADTPGNEWQELKDKYEKSAEKVYTITTTVAEDDEEETEFTFLFKKPRPASYDRYVKTISNSTTKATKMFALDNIVEEQKEYLRETFDEYPAMSISIVEKLLKMLGLADSTSVKKL